MLLFNSVYQVIDGDDLGEAAYWNTRLQSLDERLNSVEGYSADITAAINSVTETGLAYLTDTVNPVVATLVNQVDSLTTNVNSLQEALITDQDNLNSQLTALLATGNSLITSLETQLVVDGGTF